MSYEVSFEQNAGYLHAIVTGMNSRENVVRYLADIYNECVARGCFRVLIEEHLKGPRLETIDVFDIASKGRDRGAVRLPTIAYVDVNATAGLMRFAEDVAVNRGIYIRVFPSVADAVRWLRDLDNPAAEPDAPADADNPHR